MVRVAQTAQLGEQPDNHEVNHEAADDVSAAMSVVAVGTDAGQADDGLSKEVQPCVLPPTSLADRVLLYGQRS